MRPGDGHLPADPVHGSRRQGTDEPQGDEEGPAVDGRADAHRPDAVGAHGEVGRLLRGAAEQLHEQGAGDVEPLGHRGAHRRVEVHLLAREVLQPAAHPLRGDDEQREQQHGDHGEAPVEEDDGRAVGDERDHVRHHRAQRPRHRPLRTEHVVVHPARERTRLRPREERHGQPLDVVEQRYPEVVDDALTDPRGEVALDEREDRVAQRRHHDQPGQQVAAGPGRRSGWPRRGSGGRAVAAPG